MFPSEQDDDAGVLNRDFLWCMIGLFTVLSILFMFHLAERAKRADGAEPLGTVIVELRWPDGVDADVDLWVQAPGDRPVGYSNKGGQFFNLLRDDLGKKGDALELNYENAYTRGIAAGEYTVNVHLYRGAAPVTARVQVSIKTANGVSAVPQLTREVTLGALGEELTVVRFALDSHGTVRAGSVHNVFKPLRARSE